MKAHLSLFVTSLIFGLNYWVSKGLMPGYFNPVQLVLLRAFGALILVWTIQLFYKNEKIETKDMFKLIVFSLFGITLNQGLFYLGLNLTSPVDASIIHTANPILVMLIAAFIIKEKITTLKISGIVLGLTGALIIILYGKHKVVGTGTLEGNLLILLNGFSYAIYLVMVKPIMAKYKPLTVLKWVFLYGFIFTLPLIAFDTEMIHWQSISFKAWMAVLYIIVFNSFLAYLLIVYALKHVNATIAGFYAYLQPLIAAIIGIIIGAELPDIIKVIAALFIFTGVYLVSKTKKEIVFK